MRTSQHIPYTRYGFVVALAVIAGSACDCTRGNGTGGTTPDVVANPTALTFAACPTLDENGEMVAGVMPDKKKLTLDNLGKAAALLTYEIRGADKDRFSIVESTRAESLGATGGTADIEIEFAPTAGGDVTADLVIEDGSEETEPLVIKLVGAGSDLPAQPTIRVEYEEKDAPGTFSECVKGFNGEIDNCTVAYPDTFLDQTATLNLKVQSLGCPALALNQITIEPFAGTDTTQFFIEEPSVPPSNDNPLTLTTEDATVQNIRIRFEPKDDGSGDGQRYGLLKIGSNAKAAPTALITLFGYASQPAIYATPTFCDFTDAADTCNGTKAGNKALFRITNGGNVAVTIDSIAFRMPSSGRFAIGTINPLNKTIQPTAHEDLEIVYTDAPLYVTDLIDITATANGSPGDAGKATVRVSGGVLPCLSTTPVDTLDFAAVTMKTVKQVDVCNLPTTTRPSCGELQLTKQPLITQGGNFFKVVSPPAAGTTIASGTCKQVDVEFNPPVIGGLQLGTLQLETNDPDYGAPSFKKITLQSQAPLNQLPVAVLTGPDGEENAFSKKLPTLIPPELLLKGDASYDPVDATTTKPVVKWRFILTKKPTGATAELVDPADKTTSIDSKWGTIQNALLKVDKDVPGEYRVVLNVEDDTGQQSSNTAQINILLNP